MNEIISMLLPLGVTILVNIALGLYYKIGVSKIDFDKKVLLGGVAKALIVAIAFVGFAYVCGAVPMGDLGIDPKTIMTAAIATYTVKGLGNLAKIFGITVNKTAPSNTTADNVTAQIDDTQVSNTDTKV